MSLVGPPYVEASSARSVTSRYVQDHWVAEMRHRRHESSTASCRTEHGVCLHVASQNRRAHSPWPEPALCVHSHRPCTVRVATAALSTSFTASASSAVQVAAALHKKATAPRAYRGPSRGVRRRQRGASAGSGGPQRPVGGSSVAEGHAGVARTVRGQYSEMCAGAQR